MTEQENKLLAAVCQAVLGIPDTEDKGMLGDVKDIKKLLQKQNGRVRRLEIVVATIIGTLGITGGTWGITQLVLGG